MASIRVMVADDHPVVRAGLRQILSDVPDITVVAEATDGAETAARLADAGADVLLLDVSMPDAPFPAFLRQLRRDFPGVAILILSIHPEAQYAMRAIRAGASGYLTKEHSPELLLEGIRRVAAGATYLTASLADRIATELRAGGLGEPHDALSDREFEVLRLLGAGKTVNTIAAELDLSPKTVSTFRSRVLQKMGLRTTADLIRYAVEHRIF